MKQFVWVLLIAVAVTAIAPSAFACGAGKSHDESGEGSESSSEG